jgi:glycolate oxidase
MAEVQSQAGRLRQILEKGGVRGLRVASDSIEAEDIWAARRSAYAAIVRSAPTAITEDATVPRDQIPALVRRLQDLSVKYRINMAIVGHAGDGNLHPTVMTDERNVEEMHRVEAFFAEVFTIALELGGTLTGEHGVGFSKSLHMESQFGQAGLKAMRNIKMALDPRGLFNPGKMGL